MWDTVIRALEAEPIPDPKIRGASGFSHELVAAGIDRQRRRLIVVSNEADPRVTAMIQADLQAADKSIQVLTARPVWFDLPGLARIAQERLGRSLVPGAELTEFWKVWFEENKDNYNALGEAMTEDLNWQGISTLFVSMLRQIDLLLSLEPEPASADPISNTPEPAGTPPPVNIARLASIDLFLPDRSAGVCPILMTGFSASELETLRSGRDLDRTGEILHSRGISQYFFPSPDHLAVGVADLMHPSREELVRTVSMAPAIGHPFGQSELVPSSANVHDVIDALRERHMIVEGEQTIEVTPAGTAIRATVKFRPQESFFTKLLNRCNVNVSLRDLFGPPGSNGG